MITAHYILGMMVTAYNPSYSEGRDREDWGLSPAKQIVRFHYLSILLH
jgi:hypothetical protein